MTWWQVVLWSVLWLVVGLGLAGELHLHDTYLDYRWSSWLRSQLRHIAHREDNR